MRFPVADNQDGGESLPDYFVYTRKMLSEQEKTVTEANGANLAQVRELLFGTHSREVDQRCQMIEERLHQNCEELRSQIADQMTEMRHTLRDELAEIRKLIASNRTDQVEQLNTLESRVNEKIDYQTSELNQRVGQVNEEMRAFTVSETQRVLENLKTSYDNLGSKVDLEISDMRNAAAQRTSLGDMFREMATRIEEFSQA